MRYIKNGIFTDPLKVTVDGIEIELKDSQMRQLGYVSEQEYRSIQDEAFSEYDESDIKASIIDKMNVQIPQGGLPFKVGYKWNPIISGSVISFELVKDEFSLGTEDRPFLFIYGVKLLPNAFYFYQEKKYVYMGVEMNATDFDSVSDKMAEWN